MKRIIAIIQRIKQEKYIAVELFIMLMHVVQANNGSYSTYNGKRHLPFQRKISQRRHRKHQQNSKRKKPVLNRFKHNVFTPSP